VTSLVARLPLAMFSISLLIHVHRVTGSFAVAGAASGALLLRLSAALKSAFTRRTSSGLRPGAPTGLILQSIASRGSFMPEKELT
jgi:hypothetical protein